MSVSVKLPVNVPDRVLRMLGTFRGKYSHFESVFFYVPIWGDEAVGVVGDGDNAAYEWFHVKGRDLWVSDAGYGDTNVALRDALLEFCK
ncbi:MAG: hypothetical protein WC003_15520 [Terrimicrobiaceae bacterium]